MRLKRKSILVVALHDPLEENEGIAEGENFASQFVSFVSLILPFSLTCSLNKC